MRTLNQNRKTLVVAGLVSLSLITGIISEAKSENYPQCFLVNQSGKVINLSNICGKVSPPVKRQESRQSVKTENAANQAKISPKKTPQINSAYGGLTNYPYNVNVEQRSISENEMFNLVLPTTQSISSKLVSRQPCSSFNQQCSSEQLQENQQNNPLLVYQTSPKIRQKYYTLLDKVCTQNESRTCNQIAQPLDDLLESNTLGKIQLLQQRDNPRYQYFQGVGIAGQSVQQLAGEKEQPKP